MPVTRHDGTFSGRVLLDDLQLDRALAGADPEDRPFERLAAFRYGGTTYCVQAGGWGYMCLYSWCADEWVELFHSPRGNDRAWPSGIWPHYRAACLEVYRQQGAREDMLSRLAETDEPGPMPTVSMARLKHLLPPAC